MATNWPTSRDTFTNPTSGDTLDSPSHAAQHANINDAVEAMQLHAGLVLVASATATSGSALSVNNCFTSTFSSYKIVVTAFSTVNASVMEIRLRVSGSDETGSVYYSIRSRKAYATGAVTDNTSAPSTAWQAPCISDTNTSGITLAGGMAIDVHNPQRSITTTFSGAGTDPRTGGAMLNAAGMINNTTSYTGFSLLTSDTFTNCEVKVYGYNNG